MSKVSASFLVGFTALLGSPAWAQAPSAMEGLSAGSASSLSSHLSSIGSSSTVPKLNAPLADDDRQLAITAAAPRTSNALIAGALGTSASIKIGGGSSSAPADGAFANVNSASSLTLTNALSGGSSTGQASPISSIGSVAALGIRSSNALEIIGREVPATSVRLGQ